MDERLNKVFASFSGKEEELIPLLQGVQNEIGFLSDESMKAIARFARIPVSKVYGVATFVPSSGSSQGVRPI
ncbi:MAG: NAD(P)H-dependent oxidoreductase subunit E [Bacteroidales bacterium]